jgi:Xaa-Pro aminopeptidase
MNVNYYTSVREKLFEKMLPNSLCILFSKEESIRNWDVTYPYRQDSSILYLTGMNAPEFILLLHKDKNSTCSTLLFSDELSQKEVLWGSSRRSWKEYASISWIETIYPLDTWEIHCKWLQDEQSIFYTQDEMKEQIQLQFWIQNINCAESIIGELRCIKNSYEIEMICEAIDITHEAYSYIREHIKPWMYEYEIEAMIAYIFRKHHTIEAFPSIVASWGNSCILHYTHHSRILQENDWILIDFWAEYNGYSADITRSFQIWNVSDRYNEVYHAVCTLKDYAETLLKPGISIHNWNKQVKDYAFTVCERLWLPLNTYTSELNPYFPHSIGHFLWLDTHDVGVRSNALQENMIVTCEPGIYIPEEWIGIRMEDDILITKDGHQNLSYTIK